MNKLVWVFINLVDTEFTSKENDTINFTKGLIGITTDQELRSTQDTKIKVSVYDTLDEIELLIARGKVERIREIP